MSCPDCLTCEQCGRPMNPVDYAVSETCLACAKKNHKEVTKG